MNLIPFLKSSVKLLTQIIQMQMMINGPGGDIDSQDELDVDLTFSHDCSIYPTIPVYA